MGKGNNNFDPKGKLTIAEAITAEAITIEANINSQYTGDKIVSKDGYRGSVEYARKHNIIEDTESLEVSYQCQAINILLIFNVFSNI